MSRDTRTELLNAAQKAFAEKGYAGTSIRAVARDVGIRESSLYNHFDSKQALLDAVVDRAEARMAGVAGNLGVPINDGEVAARYYERVTPEHLEQVSQALVAAWLRDPDVVAARRILTLEQFRSPDAGKRLRELTIEAPLAFQTALFSRLITTGAFLPADPQAVALAFWGPMAAILAAAEATPDAPEVDDRVRLHLAHFTATHVATGHAS